MTVTFGSVCSGIEAVSVAWDGLLSPAFYAEIDASPIAVLKHRQKAFDLRAGSPIAPWVPLWGDFSALRVRHLQRFGIAMPDVLVGGTPCQSFSIAGKRLSMADDRGNLSLALVRLAHAIDNVRSRDGKPGLVVVWENVPGVFSTADNAFGCLLAGFVGSDDALRSPLEHGRWPDAGMVSGPRARAAWRVLDAQYFGLAQRRERVFVVVSFRDGPDPAEILFEPRSLRGDSPPSREAREDLAGTLGGSSQSGGFRTTDLDNQGAFIPMTSHALSAASGGDIGKAQQRTFIAFSCKDHGNDAATERTGSLETVKPWHVVAFRASGQDGFMPRNVAPPLAASDGGGAGMPTAMVFKPSHYTRGKDGAPSETHPPLSADADKGDQDPVILTASVVRRLTPVECERLQGFDDDYTLVPYRGKMMSDSGRYRMLGNSMATQVVRWIGVRLAAVIRQDRTT